jgi:hypothetical protein
MSNSAADPTPSVPSPEMRELVAALIVAVRNSDAMWTKASSHPVNSARASLLSAIRRLEEDAARLDWLINAPFRTRFDVAWREWDGKEPFRKAIDRAARTTDSPR